MTLLVFFAVTSRRGDLEILGYVMLQWLCGRLPWEKNLANKEYVGNEKMRYYIYFVYKSNHFLIWSVLRYRRYTSDKILWF